jgi:hypothetical protein
MCVRRCVGRVNAQAKIHTTDVIESEDRRFDASNCISKTKARKRMIRVSHGHFPFKDIQIPG